MIPPSPITRRSLLDGKLYLFTHNWHGGNVQNLLILTHGGIPQKNSLDGIAKRIIRRYELITPPWTTLYFYAPHGTSTFADNYSFLVGEYPHLEAYMPGEKVINYDLKHISARDPLPTSQGISEYLRDSRPVSEPNLSQHPFRVFDIVTTQPCFFDGTTLREVLDVLYRTGHLYPRIHCPFCRHERGTKRHLYLPGYHNPVESWEMVDREGLSESWVMVNREDGCP